MRIGVLGTCQAEGFAASARAFLPEADVRHFFLGACDVAEVHAYAATSDLFLAQWILAPEWGDLCTPRLPQANLAVLPNVIFTGFHPDVTVVPAWGARHSPLSGYHSALIAACFCMGVPVARVPRLFNRYVYEELGYLDEFRRARDFLVQSCAEHGYDIAERIADWAREGSFMHTINHPEIRVLFDLTRIGLAKAGLINAAADDRAVERPYDLLAAIRWPIFDVVAERLAIAPEPTFRRLTERLTLAEFAERCYADYEDADRTELTAVDGIARAIATLERAGLR